MPDYIERETYVIFKNSFVVNDLHKVSFTNMAYEMGYTIQSYASTVYSRAFVGSLDDFLTIIALCNEESNQVK